MEYKYDLAISYAGEQRHIAERLATLLQESEFSVFADFLEPERMWGEFLPEELRKVYYDESRYILILLSNEYAKKAYTLLESRIAMEKSLQGKSFLIIKLDEINLPWENTTIG